MLQGWAPLQRKTTGIKKNGGQSATAVNSNSRPPAQKCFYGIIN